jgi:putative tryptophan/tyrosine transport system substrate-binding protein
MEEKPALSGPELARRVSLSDAQKNPINPRKSILWILMGAPILILLVLVGYFLISFQNVKQAGNKVYHVGVLSALDYFSPAVDAFVKKMTELGYIQGENITYDIQKAPSPVGNQELVRKLVNDKVDLILVFPTEASLEAKEGAKGTGIPIISIGSYVEGGLIESIRHPGNDITCVRLPIAEVSVKRLEILHMIAPKAKRVWIPYLKNYPTVPVALAAVKSAAQPLGLTIMETAFAGPSEMTNYLDARSENSGMDAVLLVPEPLSTTPSFSDQIYAFAAAHGLPVASLAIRDTADGPIIGFMPSNTEFGSLAAQLAGKIFKGIPAGDIPVVTPESDLEINYKLIQKLGLTVDEGLLSTAKKIVR